MLVRESRDGAAAPFRLSHDARSAPASGSGDPTPAFRPGDLLRRFPPASRPGVSPKRSAPTTPHLPAPCSAAPSISQRLAPTSPAPRHPALAIPLHALLPGWCFSRSCSHHLRPAARLCRFAALRCRRSPRNRLPCMHFRSLARSACISVHQRVLHAFSFVSEFCMHSRLPRARFRPPGDTECMRKFLVNESACNALGAIWRWV